MIKIQQSKTADTRSCDYANVDKQTLLNGSLQHIGDVAKALAFFAGELLQAAARHDYDKLSDIDGFHADFLTGFKETGWWDRHRKLNRHHLLAADGVPADVNLIDVLDMIADCVMAGMARTGSVYPLNIAPEVLQRAFENTVDFLKAQIVVTEAEPQEEGLADLIDRTVELEQEIPLSPEEERRVEKTFERLRAEPQEEDGPFIAPLALFVEPAEEEACAWSAHPDDLYDCECWKTTCGHAFVINEGTPGDNGMRFCCYCGKSLRQRIVPVEAEPREAGEGHA